MNRKEMKARIAVALFKNQDEMSAREIAEAIDLDPKKTAHFDMLREMTESNEVEKLGAKYVISDFGLVQYGLKYNVPENTENLDKPKYKAPDEIKSVKLPKSNTAEKIDVVEGLANKPIEPEMTECVEKTAEIEHIEAKPYPFVTDSVIEDFETRAKPISEAEESIAESFDDVSPELKVFIELTNVSELANDEINIPAHYHGETMQVIDVIDDFFTPKMVEGYLMGNVVKYVLRYQKKGGVQSLKKAQWYLNRTVQDFDLFNEA